MTTSEKIAVVSATKAAIHAVVVPFVMFFTLYGTIDIAVAFWSTVGWYFVVGIFYRFTTSKQLTAKVFFLIFKKFILVLAGLYGALILLGWTITKFF